MISFILWTFLIILLGWAAFPILFWLFPHLKDRGFGVAKPAGLLVFGYLYWILVTFRIIPNTWSGIGAVFLIILLVGIFAAFKTGLSNMRGWIISHRWLIVFMEAGFVLLFGFFALTRAAYPEIIGTEKPMELAFINAILRSEYFPPADPWLSGYAISYYYFGYVMVAGIIRLTNTLSGVGFNLAVSLWFAMACSGSFSLAANILSGLVKPGRVKKNTGSGFFWALLAPVFLVFTANWEGLFESLHAKGLFWNANGQSSFWKWLDIEELTMPPSGPLSWFPSRPGGIWWWRASRVLQDYDLAGKSGGVIDEFPFFSLYLADLHPHILAMPFVLLACSLALEFFFKARSGIQFRLGWLDFSRNFWSGKAAGTGIKPEAIMPGPVFWSGALIFGGLAFLNIWDFPIYVGLASAGIVIARYLSRGWDRKRLEEFFETGLGFGLAGGLLYLPFYVGFASQAGGLLPSLAFFTRGTHLWLMFGVLFVPIFLGILTIFGSTNLVNVLKHGFPRAAGLLSVMWISMITLGMLFSFAPAVIGSINAAKGAELSAAAGQFFGVQGSAFLRDILGNTSLMRIVSPGGWITLLLLTALVWGGVIWLRERTQEELPDHLEQTDIEVSAKPHNALPFVFLLLAVGTALVLFPEFFYLRDQFGTRMNTIFKFYYQAWILWTVAAAVLTSVFWTWIRSGLRWITRIVFILSMAAGLIYPAFALFYRFDGLQNRQLTIDGNAYFYSGYPDETSAIAFLQEAPRGVVAEAIGGSYTGYARVSTHTGLQTVLGWPGHESQWRGGAKEIGSRESDIKTLYQTNDWMQALQIIQKYQIRYIYIGSMEQNTYRVNEAKFQNNLIPLFENASVMIYEVPAQTLSPSPM